MGADVTDGLIFVKFDSGRLLLWVPYNSSYQSFGDFDKI